MKPKPKYRIPTKDLPDIKRIREKEVWIQNRFIELTRQGMPEAKARQHLAFMYGIHPDRMQRLTGGRTDFGMIYPSAQTQLMRHTTDNRRT